jgi:hypothetical protein
MSRRSVTREIRAIRTSLLSIVRAVQRLGPALEAGASAVTGASVRPARKLRLSAERRAALKLQGQYMGYLRNLKPRQKAQAKALRETKGIRAAIALARKLGTR